MLERFRRDRGKSGQYMFSAGLVLLAAGLFTETLPARVPLGVATLSVLELGLVVLGIALVRMAIRELLHRLKRSALKGAAAGISLGIALPALPALGVALPSAPFVSRIAKRLPTDRVAARLPWFGVSRLERLRRAVGGARGVGAGGVGATLLWHGVRTDSLNQQYEVFGTRLDLLALALLLTVPGMFVYTSRNY